MDELPPIQWTYAGPLLVALALPLIWSSGKVYTDPQERRRYRLVQGLTLLGALLGAKGAVFVGETFWPLRPVSDPWELLLRGRSIVGGFLVGFVTAEILKPLLGHRHPPNDHFARTLAFSVAIGRLSCWLTGCCQGLPWEGPWAFANKEGVLCHPAPLYEMAFHVGVGLVLTAALRKGLWKGTFFARYMIAYGLFRFATEFVRATPKFLDPLSAYQVMCLLLVGCGLWSMKRYGGTTLGAST